MLVSIGVYVKEIIFVGLVHVVYSSNSLQFATSLVLSLVIYKWVGVAMWFKIWSSNLVSFLIR